jgi:predicted phage terminase large subunit-like protein
MQYEDDPRAEFLAFPAVDENDESNFDYPYNLGFTTEFYHEQREIMDDASWRALYMNEPIEREGTLYEASELRRYFELPDDEPDSIIAVCDTKDSGPDYCVMPIAYRYGNDFYIDKIICDNSKPEYVEARLVETLVSRKVKSCRFESNRGAGRVAESIQKRVREKGGITNITTKWSQSNKETRIITDSPFIKLHCLFLDESKYDKEYRTAMNFLTGYTMGGKNKHDDVPDAFSMLADFIQSYENGRVEVMRRPF